MGQDMLHVTDGTDGPTHTHLAAFVNVPGTNYRVPGTNCRAHTGRNSEKCGKL